MDYKKLIVKPMLITFGALLGLCIVIFSILHFFAPMVLGNWFYGIGSDEVSLYYTEKSYKQTEDYNQLYSVLNLSIKLNENEKVEKYFELFYKNTNYNSFVKNVDDSYNKNLNNLVLSALHSEDEYLKNAYISALVKQNKINKAIEFANNNSSFVVDENNIGEYLYKHILTSENNINQIADLTTFGSSLESYFNLNIATFNIVKTQDVRTALALSSRINNLAINLIQIDIVNDAAVTLSVDAIVDAAEKVLADAANLI